MGWLMLFVLPTAFFVILDLVVFGRPPEWAVAAVENARRRWHPPKPVEYDPFDALEIQERLAALSAEIRRLDDDGYVFAKAHRVRVAETAYDSLLDDACRLAGVEPAVRVPGPRLRVREEGERMRDEMELASRGWLW